MLRRSFLAALFCSAALPALAAPTFVQQALAPDGNNTGNTSLSFGATVGSGNLVVGIYDTCGVCGATIPPPVTDDKGNSYTSIGHVSDANGQDVGCFWKNNITNAPITITVSPGASGQFTRISIAEFSGVDTTATPTDGSAIRQTTTGTATDGNSSGNITTTVNGDLLYSGTGDGGASSGAVETGGTSFTRRNTSLAGATIVLAEEDRVQATAGAVAGTWTSSANVDIVTCIIAFKAAAAAATPRFRTLMGVGQ